MIITKVKDKKVLAALQRAAVMVDNTEPLMRNIANLQMKSTIENFRTESFAGRRWPRLARSTAQRFITGKPGTRRKKKRGKGMTKRQGKQRGYKNILRPTGQHLLQKLHQSSNKDEARISCATDWAFVHNFGARMQHFQMPQRTFLGITRDDEQNIMDAVERQIDKALGI